MKNYLKIAIGFLGMNIIFLIIVSYYPGSYIKVIEEDVWVETPCIDLIYTVTATCYHPTIEQTDDSPFITSDGSKINKKYPFKHRWIALSRDLLKSINYGDTIYIKGTWIYDGPWIVHDKMNRRYNDRVDFLIQEGMPSGAWKNVTLTVNE